MVLTKSTSNRTAKLIFKQVSFSVLFIHIFWPYTLMLMTQLFLSFCADSIDNKTAAFSVMKCCIANIHHWMLRDKLTFNDEKTEFLLIGTRQSTISSSFDIINFGSYVISSVTVACSIGSWCLV